MATVAAAKQNASDIVSVTYDGCEMLSVVLLCTCDKILLSPYMFC